MDSIISALTTSSFAWPLQFCLFSTVVTYIASVLTSNVSQVDRVWTFLPLIYTAYFALLPLWPLEQTIPLLPFVPSDLQSESQDIFWSPRALILLFLVTIWMFRLSYNTYRRGLFSLSDEDYRWAVLRAQLPPFLFQLVNLTFIAATQNLLLLTLGYPAYLASMQKPQMLYSDAFLELWALGVLLIEFTADNQQFVYQTYKHAYLDHFRKAASSSAAHTHALEVAFKVAWPFASPSPAQSISTANASDSGRTLLTNLRLTPTEAHRGFITSGFWAYSRHPNFACEQTFWWIICFIPFSARAYPLVMFGEGAVTSFLEVIMSALENIKSTFTFTHLPNPTSLTSLTPFLPLLPALLLSILFFSSTLYTEAISKSKYPSAYTAYQTRVPMFAFLSVPLTMGLVPVVVMVQMGTGMAWMPAFVPLVMFVGISLGTNMGGGGDAGSAERGQGPLTSTATSGTSAGNARGGSGIGPIRPMIELALGKILVPVLNVIEWIEVPVGKWWYFLRNGKEERKRVERLVWGEVQGEEGGREKEKAE